MCTVKWHSLDHIFGDIRRNGSLFLSGANLYEYVHKVFKSKYWRTSKGLAKELGDSIHIAEVRNKHDEEIVESVCRKGLF